MSVGEFPADYGKGTCTCCGKKNVPLAIVGEDIFVCEDCWDNEFERCDVCGEMYSIDSDIIHYDEEKDRFICEYCEEDEE